MVDAARLLKNSLSRSPTSILADQASRALISFNLGASQATRNSTASSSPESQYITRQEFMKWQNQVQTAPQNYAPVGPKPPLLILIPCEIAALLMDVQFVIIATE